MTREQLQIQFPHLSFQEGVVLAPFTYMKVGGTAKLFVEVETVDDLFSLSSFCFTHTIPFSVLGGLSNTIISDEGMNSLVIRNKTSMIQFQPAVGEKVQVIADSGVITATLASETMRQNLTGLEHFVGVPGTIGGAVYNNSHFTAHELIGNFITSVEVCTEEGERETWEKEKLSFGYDYSIFHETKAVILQATFQLFLGDPVHIQEKMLEAAKKRTATQPIGVPSTGCMWRNPKIDNDTLRKLQEKLTVPESALKVVDGNTQIAAGFLIDRAGLKGTQVGDAQVSEKHATYIINLGTASTKDIDTLATKVEQKVKETFGIELEREVFFLQ